MKKILEKILLGLLGLLVCVNLFIVACAMNPGLSGTVGGVVKTITPKPTEAEEASASATDNVNLVQATDTETDVSATSESTSENIEKTETQEAEKTTEIVQKETYLEDNSVTVAPSGTNPVSSRELLEYLGQNAEKLTASLEMTNDEAVAKSISAGLLNYGGIFVQVWNADGYIYSISLSTDEKSSDYTLLGIKPGMAYDTAKQSIEQEYGTQKWATGGGVAYGFYFYRNDVPIFGSISCENDVVTDIEVHLDITGTIDPANVRKINNPAFEVYSLQQGG